MLTLSVTVIGSQKPRSGNAEVFDPAGYFDLRVRRQSNLLSDRSSRSMLSQQVLAR
jgi:hypothetical protein